MDCIPIIDLGVWMKDLEGDHNYNATISKEEVVSEIQMACEKTGFFALKIPNVMQTVIDDAAATSRRFFSMLSEDEKGAYLAGPENAYGYFPMESEALGYEANVDKRPDLREAFSMGPTCAMSKRLMGLRKEIEKSTKNPEMHTISPEKDTGTCDVSDKEMLMKVMSFCYQQTPFRRYRSTNNPSKCCDVKKECVNIDDDEDNGVVENKCLNSKPFIPSPQAEKNIEHLRNIEQEFENNLSRFYDVSSKLGNLILKIMAVSLGLREDHFTEASSPGEHSNSARAIWYPKLKTPAETNQFRCGAHSDSGALTILWSDTPGLQLQDRSAGGGAEGAGKEKYWKDAWPKMERIENAGKNEFLIVNIGDLLQNVTKGKWKSTPHRVPAPTLDDKIHNRDRLVLVLFVILAADFCIDETTKMTQGEYLYRHFKRWGRNKKE